jgi:hypothetical protein
MIKTLEIQNFRCYEQVFLENLARINVVVGENASGKTALLEALYMSLGNPALVLKLRNWRGLSVPFQITESAESHSVLWRDLFFQFDLSKEVVISIKGSQPTTRTLRFQHYRDNHIVIPVGKTDPRVVSPFRFEWYRGTHHIASVRPEFQGGNLSLTGGPEPLPGAYFSSATPIDPGETGAGFSELSKARKEGPIVDVIKNVFPFIENLAVETLNIVPVVHADIPNLQEKIPLGLVSSGVNKLVSILIAITNQAKGIIMVDEIENGLYYGIMEQVWKAMYDSCRKHQSQLFVSSHNKELLKKLYPTIKGNEEDFCLIRTERQNGVCTARVFGGTNFTSALEQGMDVR